MLQEIGVSVLSQLSVDLLKHIFRGRKELSCEKFKEALKMALGINESDADSIIDFLAENGEIKISGATIIAEKIVSYSSLPNSSIRLESGTTSKTKNTLIATGEGSISITGKSSITQRG